MIGERGRAPGPPALSVELDAQLTFEGEKPASDALFGDAERSGRAANLALPRELNKSRDLIGTEVRQPGGHRRQAQILL